MRFLGAGILMIGLAAFAGGCCLPLEILSCCLGSVPSPNLTAAAAVDRAKLDEVPATVPVAATAQKF